MRRTNAKNAAEKRERIVRAALQCFSDLGLQNATIKDICRVSGMRSGHIYYYFPSKAHIVEEVYNIGLADMVDRLRSMLASGDIVSAMYENYHTAEKKRREWNITPALRLELIAETSRNPKFASIYKDVEFKIGQEIRASVARAVDSGKLKSSLSVDDVANSLLLFWSAFTILGITDEPSPESFRETIRQLLLPHMSKPLDGALQRFFPEG